MSPTDGDPDLVAIVEALLFAAERPVSADRLAAVLAEAGDGGVEPGAAAAACAELESRYLESDSALQVVEVAGGYRIGTRPRFDRWVRELRREERSTQLSEAALETLAVVAYRQPVTLAEVADIRGVDPDSALRTLREMGLVKVTGRKRTVGRPFKYGTTDKFLETFGLRDLDELPAQEEFEELLEG